MGKLLLIPTSILNIGKRIIRISGAGRLGVLFLKYTFQHHAMLIDRQYLFFNIAF